jgi:hypothetical protein
MKGSPPLKQAARFGRRGLRRRVHQIAVGRHDHEDRVGPVCEQDRGSEQPTPVEGAECAPRCAAGAAILEEDPPPFLAFAGSSGAANDKCIVDRPLGRVQCKHSRSRRK